MHVMNPDRSRLPKTLEALQKQSQELYDSIHASSGQTSSGEDGLNRLLEKFWSTLVHSHTRQTELQHQNQELNAAHKTQTSQYAYYRELFEFAPASYIITNAEGKILDANRAATRLLKAESDALLGKPLSHFIASADQGIFVSNLAQLKQGSSDAEWEVKIQRDDGSEFSTALTVSVVRSEDSIPVKLHWQLLDITPYKQAETQAQSLKAFNQQVAEVDRLKAQFLAVMSHELRTPIHIVSGFSQLLLRRFQAQRDPQLIDMTERIVGSSHHLLSLVEDILDHAQLQSKRLQLKIEPLDLTDLITTAVEEIRPLARRKNLALQIELPQAGLLVENDPVRLKQVIANLLSNAIKFTDRGAVTLSVRELPEDRIAIAVQDTGIGIAESDKKAIFQGFCQLSQSLSRQHEGTGLGLSITHALVELMQGKISVESILGQGTTFCVQLPRVVTSAESA
ncbi:MAG: PAS domain-containing sensor histidine kinase [Myxacorys californica WJT36-NPBG1]|nr:PAS domain-containing sensor histidine kinase [Myxacorys californica WJT36-NPBG1]